MDARDDKLGRSAYWCGILQGDARPVAAGVAVRTVRGAFTACRPSDPKPDEESLRPPHQPRRA
jgi:hypothetical protein